MTLVREIPGREALRLEYLLLDANGTLTEWGKPIDGVAGRLAAFSGLLEPIVLSADTFGTLSDVSETLGVRAERVSSGSEKAAFVASLGASRCAAIGNGANDEAMLDAVALGIAVVGKEGAAVAAVRAADVVCASILDALDLLLDGRALSATLRV